MELERPERATLVLTDSAGVIEGNLITRSGNLIDEYTATVSFDQNRKQRFVTRLDIEGQGVGGESVPIDDRYAREPTSACDPS